MILDGQSPGASSISIQIGLLDNKKKLLSFHSRLLLVVLGISAFSCSAFGLVEQYPRAIVELLGSVWYIGQWMHEEIFITGMRISSQLVYRYFTFVHFDL